jgi:hypothetical protein
MSNERLRCHVRDDVGMPDHVASSKDEDKEHLMLKMVG